MLPRLSLVDMPDNFIILSKIGRDLAKIHINYETIRQYSDIAITGKDNGNFTVDKLCLSIKTIKILFNIIQLQKIFVIALVIYDYIINSKSII
jgi:predicted helicase